VVIAEYSAIKYKTPWCMLTFLTGLIVLAGIGVSAAMRLMRYRVLMVMFALALAWPVKELMAETYKATVKLPTDARNPYVYSGTLLGVLDFQREVEELNAIRPGIQVAVDLDASWPLGWYLRRVEWGRYESNKYGLFGDVYICRGSAGDETGLEKAGLVEDVTFSLRPNFRLKVYVKKELVEEQRKRRAERGK
jgi:hypothetical protein